jgi:hypothetical protein
MGRAREKRSSSLEPLRQVSLFNSSDSLVPSRRGTWPVVRRLCKSVQQGCRLYWINGAARDGDDATARQRVALARPDKGLRIVCRINISAK